MAEKRMFSEKVTNSDLFLDMPLSTQALYFHLNMSADDDGFLDNPRMVMRMIGAGEDDMRLLIAKGLVITWENSAVIVIKDWRIHNTIRKDRKKDTIHTNEFKKLKELSNGSYQKLPDECHPVGNQVTTSCQPKLVSEIDFENEKPSHINGYNGLQPIDNQVATECPHRLDEIRLDKVRLDKNSVDESQEISPIDEPPATIWQAMDLYQQVYGFPNMVIQEDMSQLTADVGDDLLTYAIKIAAKNDVRGKGAWNYIEAIVADWQKFSVKTLEEAERHQDNWNKQKKNNRYQNKSVKKESLPEWAVEPNVKETPMSEEDQAYFKQQIADMKAKGKKLDE